MPTSETAQKWFSFLALGSAIIASGFLFWRIVSGEIPLEESSIMNFLPVIGAAVIATPSLQRMAISKRLEKLELERLEAEKLSK